MVRDAHCVPCSESVEGYCWLHAPVTEGGSVHRGQARMVMKNHGPMLKCNICGFQSLSMTGHPCAQAFEAGASIREAEIVGHLRVQADLYRSVGGTREDTRIALILDGEASAILQGAGKRP